MYFFLKLLPPRPTFAADMSQAERALMQEHVSYWTGLVAKGLAKVFGPVADPAGGYGIGIIEVTDLDEARRLEQGDPVIRAGLGFKYEIMPMPRVVLG